MAAPFLEVMTMRVLMWFTIGFAAACALSIYLGISAWIGLVTVVAAGFLFVLKKPAAKVTAVMLLGITAGMLWTTAYNNLYLDFARKYDGKTAEASATVTDYSYETDYGVAADAQTELYGKKFKLRLYYPKFVSLQPGDRIEGKFRFRLTTDDSEQGGTYHQGKGIFLLAYVDEEAVVVKTAEPESKFFGSYLRKRISVLIASVFPADTIGLPMHFCWVTAAFWTMKQIRISNSVASGM
jgi:hypothetical protein